MITKFELELSSSLSHSILIIDSLPLAIDIVGGLQEGLFWMIETSFDEMSEQDSSNFRIVVSLPVCSSRSFSVGSSCEGGIRIFNLPPCSMIMHPVFYETAKKEKEIIQPKCKKER